MRFKALMLAAIAVATPAFAQTQTPPAAADESRMRQVGAAVLFWSQEERFKNFPAMEKIFPGNVAHAGKSRPLAEGAPLPIAESEVEAYMSGHNVSGVLVLQDGKIRLERYGFGYGPTGRWTSFSVAKSFTSTLVGAAIKDGYITSLDEPVTKYIPDLAGSAYDGVTIAQLMTMTSGVKWNEDYTDPKSDVARMFAEPVKPGEDPTVAFMKTLPREAAPGSKWVYKTGETNLIGVLVRNATKKTLAAYLEEKVWKPYGMERDAFWMTDQTGKEVSGCCLSVSLHDYGRMGQLALDGGKGIVPDGWFADATRSHAEIGRPGFGYGYQWWTFPGELFGAQGIFGQSITVDRATRTVIVINSAWPVATGQKQSVDRFAFVGKLLAAAGKK